MAIWRIETRRGSRKLLVHWNGLSRRRHAAGEVTEQPAERVFEWVVEHAQPFDVLLLDTREVYVVLPERGVQA